MSQSGRDCHGRLYCTPIRHAKQQSRENDSVSQRSYRLPLAVAEAKKFFLRPVSAEGLEGKLAYRDLPMFLRFLGLEEIAQSPALIDDIWLSLHGDFEKSPLPFFTDFDDVVESIRLSSTYLQMSQTTATKNYMNTTAASRKHHGCAATVTEESNVSPPSPRASSALRSTSRGTAAFERLSSQSIHNLSTAAAAKKLNGEASAPQHFSFTPRIGGRSLSLSSHRKGFSKETTSSKAKNASSTSQEPLLTQREVEELRECSFTPSVRRSSPVANRAPTHCPVGYIQAIARRRQASQFELSKPQKFHEYGFLRSPQRDASIVLHTRCGIVDQVDNELDKPFMKISSRKEKKIVNLYLCS